MKRVSKIVFIFIFVLFMVPSLVKAETVCQDGCDFDSLDAVLADIEEVPGDFVNIDVRDAHEYIIGDHDLSGTNLNIYSSMNNNINISGASESTRLKSGMITFGGMYNPDNYVVTLKNLNLYPDYTYQCNSEQKGMCAGVYMGANSMIDNVTINSQYAGLELVKGTINTINKYTFNGDNFAVVVSGYSQTFPLNSITITNSKLANCNCSIGIYDYGMDVAKSFDVRSAKARRIAFTNYNVKIDSSEVNCAKYGADSSSFATNPTIYFTANNDWKAAINRGTDFNSFANIVEGYNSKVVIDMEKKDTIKLSSKVSLQNYFDELKDVNPGDIQWRVADPKILKIENGKVIPLRIGTTTVTATYKNNNYSIEFRVTALPNVKEVISNPKTGASIFLVVALLFLTGVLTYSYVLVQKKKVKN